MRFSEFNKINEATKPTVNLADPRQAAVYKAQLDLEKAGVPLNKTNTPLTPSQIKTMQDLGYDPARTVNNKPSVWTNPRTGVTSSTPPVSSSDPAVWKNNRTGQVSSTPPVSNTSSGNIPNRVGIDKPGASVGGRPVPNDNVGTARPGEPSMGREVPVKPASTPPANTAAYDTGYNAGKKVRATIDAGVDAAKGKISSTLGQKTPALDTSTRIDPVMGKEVPANRPNVATGVEAGAEAGAKAGAKSIGKKVLGRVIPGAGIALDAEEAYRRYQKGDRTGAVISALGAAGGFVPGFGPAISFGAMGVNAARDAYNSPAKSTNLNPVTSAANAAAANKGMTGRGGQSPVQPSVKSQPPAPAVAPPTTPNTDEKGVDVPEPNNTTPNSRNVASPDSGYKGSAGAQSIQQANADKIKDVNKIRAGDTIKVGGQDYTIKRGDTLDGIAKTQLASSNPSVSTDNKNDKLPDEDVSSVQADESKSLNRIKSLAGLK